MGCGKADEFSGCYDFGILPESREMPLIARDQVVRARRIGTFQEDAVIGIACDFQSAVRNHSVAVGLDELEQLVAEALANLQFRAAKHVAVFHKDGTGHVKASRFGNREDQDSTLEARRPKSSRNQDICIDYQTERKH
jgi:hypothetical protein